MGNFEDAIARIDALNAKDPNTLSHAGESAPKELLHGRLVSAWVAQLAPDASEALRLAARAHHVRRWEIPRTGYPAGRAGYLRWRHELQDFHAQVCDEILLASGYTQDEARRVGALIRKRDLRANSEAQTLEDAICLVFFETQAEAFASKEPEKIGRILSLTLRKMSLAGRDAARGLSVSEGVSSAIAAALDATPRSTTQRD